MGVDLTLIPVMYDTGGTVFPHTKITLNRRRELWAVIEEAKIERPLGRAVYWTAGEDEKLQPVTETPYGTPWTYATAGDLLGVMAPWLEANDPTDWENRAAVAYLKELPPNMTIVLRWH